MKRLLTPLFVSIVLSGCAASSDQLSQYALRPVAVLQYGLPSQTVTNNLPAVKGAIGRVEGVGKKPVERQIVVVATIGEGGAVVAMERARNAALMLEAAGEFSPRMYVQQPRQNWQSDTVEVFAMQKSQWNDKTFSMLMQSESSLLSPMGGVIKSETARKGLDQALEHRLQVNKGELITELRRVLGSVGWAVESYSIPLDARVNAFTLAVALGEEGVASPDEASSIANTIISKSSRQNIQVISDIRRNVIEIHGEGL